MHWSKQKPKEKATLCVCVYSYRAVNHSGLECQVRDE
jgi:hypothetical protein